MIKDTIHSLIDYLGSILIIISFIIIISYFVLDCLYPPSLIQFDYGMIPVARDYTHNEAQIQTFNPGDIVPLKLKGYKYTNDVPKAITNRLVGTDAIMTLPNTPPQPKERGPFDFVSLDRRVPGDSISGLVYIEITYIYSRNFIRDQEVYKIRTEPFNVTKNSVPHDDAEDEALIKKILKQKEIKK